MGVARVRTSRGVSQKSLGNRSLEFIPARGLNVFNEAEPSERKVGKADEPGDVA